MYNNIIYGKLDGIIYIYYKHNIICYCCEREKIIFIFDKYQNIEYNNFNDRTTRITHLIVRCCRL